MSALTARAGRAHHAADALHIAVELVHIGHRLARLVHLNQAVDHLNVIHKVVPLGAHLAVEVFELRIRFLQLLRAAHHAQAGQRRADIRQRAPADDGEAQQRHHPHDALLHPAEQHPPHERQHHDSGDNLQHVDGDGYQGGFFHLEMVVHLFLSQIESHALSLSNKNPMRCLSVTARDFPCSLITREAKPDTRRFRAACGAPPAQTACPPYRSRQTTRRRSSASARSVRPRASARPQTPAAGTRP